jgi:hypothetical protein
MSAAQGRRPDSRSSTAERSEARAVWRGEDEDVATALRDFANLAFAARFRASRSAQNVAKRLFLLKDSF